jgi:hypothetical protein
MSMDEITIDTFMPLAGSDFEVEQPGVVLRLERVAAVMESERAKLRSTPFSLFFRGPAKPHLPQHTYTFRHPAFSEPLQIFIVPVGRNNEGFDYEAVFT